MISKWIMSEGGPLIVMNDNLKKNWGGIFRLTILDGDARNDYDRACRVSSCLDTVPIVGGVALTIGDIPMESCFWHSQPDYFGILQVCYCAENFHANNTMESYARNLETLKPEQAINFQSQGGDLLMFDSSDGGDREPELVSSALSAGSYVISTYAFEPDEETSLVFHAFQRRL